MKFHLCLTAALLALLPSFVGAQPPVGDWFIMRTAPGGAFMALSDESGKSSLMRGCTRRQCMWILSVKGDCADNETTTLRLLAPKAVDAAARCMGRSQINTGLHDWVFLDEGHIDALVRRGVRFKVQVAAGDAAPVEPKFNARGGARAFKRLEELLAAE